ncbi:NUDIX domain-containing protein [Bacillus cereus]|uniref:NUDIX hydrolase n=1 Tax=unclassified Bacillus (in: firmicutes) TaxID=185979 RepID=UPI00047B71E9|nr:MULTISPECIES: NUDIX domain-containing protein [unclassified Bacillus (in: firmicutes)]PFE02939.1 NUDIX domain-containing protein [Bacillus sp. AFS023182]PGX92424.1 NUDIX domain-containing protein [Bacillus cereus]
MTEWLTIFDPAGNNIGKKLRDDVHRDGDWHETFHCWFVERENEDISLYFQLRAKNKKDFPGKWDITSAGHIMHNEDVRIGGLREIEEELGLSFQATDLEYKGIFKINHEIPHFIDREMCHMYFHAVTKSLPFAPGDEVEDVMKITATSFLQLLKREVTSATGISISNKNAEPITITFADIYPYELEYYEFVIEKSRDILNNNNL